MDVYSFVVENIYPITNSFSIFTRTHRMFNESEFIVVENEEIKYLELIRTRSVNGSKVKISEHFTSKEDRELLDGLVRQVQEIHETQKQMKLKK